MHQEGEHMTSTPGTGMQGTLQKAAEDLRSRLTLALTNLKRTRDQQQQLARDRETGWQCKASGSSIL